MTEGRFWLGWIVAIVVIMALGAALGALHGCASVDSRMECETQCDDCKSQRVKCGVRRGAEVNEEDTAKSRRTE